MSSDVWLSVPFWTALKNSISLKKMKKRRRPSHLQQKSTFIIITHLFTLLVWRHQWIFCHDLIVHWSYLLSTLKHVFVNQFEQFETFVMHKSNICMDWVCVYMDLSISEEQIPGALLGRKDFWRKMFKSQSAASDTSSQSEQDTSECTTAHSGTTTERRSRSRSRRISLRKKLKLPIGMFLWERNLLQT